jgi:hypothetical protein
LTSQLGPTLQLSGAPNRALSRTNVSSELLRPDDPESDEVIPAVRQSVVAHSGPGEVRCAQRVERLRAILVSPLTADNFVKLLWRTSCESDVVKYEIHRSRKRGFQPDESTRIGVAQADTIVVGLRETGHPLYDHVAGDYDHIMYRDGTVLPKAIYYYRVCATDTAGQRGPFSEEVAVRTKNLSESH